MRESNCHSTRLLQSCFGVKKEYHCSSLLPHPSAFVVKDFSSKMDRTRGDSLRNMTHLSIKLFFSDEGFFQPGLNSLLFHEVLYVYQKYFTK